MTNRKSLLDDGDQRHDEVLAECWPRPSTCPFCKAATVWGPSPTGYYNCWQGHKYTAKSGSM